MKKFTITSVIVAVFSLSILSTVHATVGGETLIQSILYSPSNSQQIIYKVQNYGGKGCPPEIFSFSTQTGVSTALISCNDADGTSQTKFNSISEDTLSQYPNLLRHIDLSKNKISARLTLVAEQEVDEASQNFGRADFHLDVFQNGEKKTGINYSGCSKDQVHIVEGYIVPNKNWMALLVSTKGDCFEGGYASENLYLVPNITLYNQAPLLIKDKGATAGNGNLSLIATTPIVPQTQVQTPKAQDQSQTTVPPASSTIVNPAPKVQDQSGSTVAPAPQTTIVNPIITTPDNSWVYLIIIVLLIGTILILILRKR